MTRFLKGLSYTFQRNLGKADRIIRFLIGFLLLSLFGFGWLHGVVGTAVAIFALMLIGTAASARCGATYWLNANTMTAEEKTKLEHKGIKYE